MEIEDVVPELLHEYVNGYVPPVTTALALPVLSPKHKTSTVFIFTDNTNGSVTVTLFVTVQPLLSVTNTVQVPAGN